MEVGPVISVPQTAHKYPTSHKKLLKKVYNTVITELISAHAQPTPREITDHQYLNIMDNSIIYYETGELPEYRNLIKRDKQKNTWVKYFANALVRLAQGVGDRVKVTDTIIPGTQKNSNR